MDSCITELKLKDLLGAVTSVKKEMKRYTDVLGLARVL